MGRILFVAGSLLLVNAMNAGAQETPYFITYSSHMEEPGNLEVAANFNAATQKPGNGFVAPWVEFEYGVRAWWTSELYFDSQTTFHDGTVFTGIRWENRFRPLMTEHWINPVIYVEYEDVTGADKAMLEVVGTDAQTDYGIANREAQRERKHEGEAKLILSGDAKGWNYSMNYIGEKNLGHAPWEFGYAMGVSRPLRLSATAQACNFCRENLVAGLEMYGGLGTAWAFSVSGTSHYLAPVVEWQLPSGMTVRVSPGYGLNGNSHVFVVRWGVSYEIAGAGRKMRSLF